MSWGPKKKHLNPQQDVKNLRASKVVVPKKGPFKNDPKNLAASWLMVHNSQGHEFSWSSTEPGEKQQDHDGYTAEI